MCCRKPAYDFYGPHIIMNPVGSLLNNDWIIEHYSTWGSQVVLAAKPHQEHGGNIKNFV